MQAQFFWTPSPEAHLQQGEHDPFLVLLSLAVCCIASGQALRLAAFARQAVTPQLRCWSIAGGSLALGTGIWAMHFIGMLAYSLHGVVHYEILLTVLSILPGIAASAVALTLLSRNEVSSKQLMLGGLIVGVGIATMHYSGMAAMRMQSPYQYSPFWFAVSLVVGVALATLALWVHSGLMRFKVKHATLRKTLAALIMGGAIAGMHYIAMLALRVTADHGNHSMPSTNDKLILSLTIAGRIQM